MCQRKMRTSVVLIWASTALLATGAQAQLVTEPLADDQFHVVQTDDGLLRINRRTGDVSQCRNEDIGWVCRLSPDDRLAYEAEINRLDTENERLRAEVDQLEQVVASAGQDRAPDNEIASRMGLPSDQEIDVVMDTAEEVMRRFFGMVHRLRDDIQQNHSADQLE